MLQTFDVENQTKLQMHVQSNKSIGQSNQSTQQNQSLVAKLYNNGYQYNPHIIRYLQMSQLSTF